MVDSAATAPRVKKPTVRLLVPFDTDMVTTIAKCYVGAQWWSCEYILVNYKVANSSNTHMVAAHTASRRTRATSTSHETLLLHLYYSHGSVYILAMATNGSVFARFRQRCAASPERRWGDHSYEQDSAKLPIKMTLAAQKAVSCTHNAAPV